MLASPAHQYQSHPLTSSPTATPSHVLTPTNRHSMQQAPASPIPVPSPVVPRPRSTLQASAISLTALEDSAEFVLQLAPRRSSFASSADDLSLVSASGSMLSSVVESQAVVCERNDGGSTSVQDSKPVCTAPVRGKCSSQKNRMIM